jgi:hypothetical protein
MRRSKLTFSKILSYVEQFLKDRPLPQIRRRGRSKIYTDEFIIALWLFQVLHKFSYREVLEYVSNEGYSVPALGNYHYRVKKLPLERLQNLIGSVSKEFFRREGIRLKGIVVDGTGFGYRERYVLRWLRGTEVKEVSAHVKVVVIVGVDERNRIIPLDCEVSGAYTSEIVMLRGLLERMRKGLDVPFVGDKGFDAVDILKILKERGCELGIRMKETWRMGIRHPLRKESKEGWERWGKGMRYLIGGLFGNVKLKLGSVFPLMREDLALKRALAVFVLYVFFLWASIYRLLLFILDGNFFRLIKSF